jgi:catecholate siderophore receptor
MLISRKAERVAFVAKAVLLSVSSIAIAAVSSAAVRAQPAQQSQTPAAQSGASQLPPVQVSEPKRKPRRRNTPGNRANTTTAARRPQPARTPAPAGPVVSSQDARTGTVGVYQNSTSVATKVNTALINVPQSVNLVTKQFIQDQNFQSLTDVTRYVPGVAVHQGEGNRDELVIRGVDSSANFFVNGFRDDVQIFRDLYNTQSLEVLKGPSALTFGRGACGGLVNRTLKEADGTRVYEATAQTGSYNDKRFTLDAGQAVNPDLAVRLNAMYEGTDTFRDFGTIERFGINPTVTYTPTNNDKVKLSYEYYHDGRTADRGNPSLGQAPGRTGPTVPFAPNDDLTKYFGSPNLNVARADVHTAMASVEHDFQNGLTVKNATLFANYQKFYQNVFAGSSVNPVTGAFTRSAYQHWTNRENLINQTDFVYKTNTGPLAHTFAFGAEFDHQSGIDLRNTGNFANGTPSEVDNAFNPTYFGPISFVHQGTDSNSTYTVKTQSAYARDTIDVFRWLQLIGGARIDRFDIDALNVNTNVDLGRVDTKISPQAAVIVKPVDNLSIYGTYMVSYLPASGDQFSSLNVGSAILEPQKFENKEVGVKWNINPRLLFSVAGYQLDRTNVPLNDPTHLGFFIPSGKQQIRGFEGNLTGYVTKDWQSIFGYAYTDARITANSGAPTAGIFAGNRVQLVPYNQFSWWNKYQFTPVWAASLGLIYFSNSYASSDDLVKLPGFFRVDAAIYAKINETWRAQLNVENIFDKGYWASADGDNNITPGQPRTFRLMAIAKF